MKTLLVTVVFFGLLGFIFDYSIRKFHGGKTLLEKITGLKQLLNIVVYGSGGVFMYLIHLIPLFNNINFIYLYCFIGSIICSIVEFGYGYLLNIVLKLNIWDYSGSAIKIFGRTIPLNIMGQVDIYHFFAWGLLSIPVYNLNTIIEWVLRG